MHGQAKIPVSARHIAAQNKLRKSVMLLRSLFFRRRRKNKDADGIFRFHTAVMYEETAVRNIHLKKLCFNARYTQSDGQNE